MKVLCITEHSDRPEAETIIGLKRLGVDIHLFCPSTAPHLNRFLKVGIPVTDIKFKARIDVRAIRFVRKWIILNQPDILHLFNNRAVSNGILASRKLPVKIIAYRGVVGNMSYCDPGSWMTYLHPRVDRIICVCEEIRRFFLNLKCLWLRFPSHKPITIYKGHDPAWYQEKPGDLRPFGIPENAFSVGCTGRHQRHKGIHVLIDAMHHIPESLPIHLLLIGNLNTPALIKQIRKSPRRNRIHLAGYRPDSHALQAACDTVVLPTLKREGLSKVVIEAMINGVPPIVTSIGGNPELVENGVSGIVVHPGRADEIAQAIVHLYQNSQLLSDMGKNAKRRITEYFKIENTIQQTFRVYESLTS